MKTEETASIARQAAYESITNDDTLKLCASKNVAPMSLLNRLITGKYQLFDIRDSILRFKNDQENA